MEIVNIHEAKTHLSRLLDKVSQGEPVIIARAGKPVARVSRLNAPEDANQAGRIGFMKDQIQVPDDFDRMGEEEIARMFGG